MDKEVIKQVLVEQREIFSREDKIVYRAVPENAVKSPKIVVITGVRRCGKSTFLKQVSKSFKDYSYANFEDERLLEFTYADFNLLLGSILELNPKTKALFFDEIQNIKGWEKFVRRLFEEGYKIFITGSNACLLSSEIATALTGRNLRIDMYPFSFKEYLSFYGFQQKQVYTTKEKADIANYFEQYVKFGGFPEIAQSKDYDELSSIYQDIIIKDLLVRLQIRDTKDFRELALYLLSNISKKMSYNNLKNLLGFSTTSKVKSYVDDLSEAYLLFTTAKYDPSIKKQIVNDRKIYAVDVGIVNSIAFHFSKDMGRILENIAFIELKRRYKDIYYFEDNQECDFLIRQGTKITHALQVTASLADAETKKREIGGLLEALERFKLKEGVILNYSQEDKLEIDGKKIYIIPLWKWLIS